MKKSNLRRLDVLPKRLVPVHRASARSLLLVEKQNLQHVRAAMTGVALAFAADAATKAFAGQSSEAQRSAILAALAWWMRRMGTETEKAIKAARLRAAAVGWRRSLAELEVLAGYEIVHSMIRPKRQEMASPEDEASASSSATALAAAWAGSIVAQFGIDTATNVVQAILSATQQGEHRIERTVTTETAKAFDAGKRELATEAGKAQPVPSLILMERWDSTLDSRVCPTCAGLDGELTLPGAGFGPFRPGYVHPRCRCISTLVAVPAIAARAAA